MAQRQHSMNPAPGAPPWSTLSRWPLGWGLTALVAVVGLGLGSLGALLRGSPLLLLDEPFTGLDVATRRGLWALVHRQKAAGVAVLLVSHDRDDIEALADRRCRLESGRLV